MNNVINLVKMQFENLFSLNKSFLPVIAISISLPFLIPEMFASAVALMVVAFTNLTIGREKKCNIDNLISTLPVNKKEYILSKYLFGIIGVILSAMIMSIVALMLTSSLYISVECVIISALIVGTVMVGIVVPLIAILGAEKCNIFLAIIMAITVTFINRFPELLSNINMLSKNKFFLLIIISSSLIIYVSYLVTVRIYKKIEF